MKYFAERRAQEQILVNLTKILRIFIVMITDAAREKGSILEGQVIHGPVAGLTLV